MISRTSFARPFSALVLLSRLSLAQAPRGFAQNTMQHQLTRTWKSSKIHPQLVGARSRRALGQKSRVLASLGHGGITFAKQKKKKTRVDGMNALISLPSQLISSTPLSCARSAANRPRMLHGCSRVRRLGSPARELPESVCTLQPLFDLAATYEQGCGSRSFCFVAPTPWLTAAGLQMSRVLSCDAAPFTSC